MIASAQTIRMACKGPPEGWGGAWPEPMISPFAERTEAQGMTYGLGPAGYDVRIAETFTIAPSDFYLASTMERFSMPTSMLGMVADKSTLARMGLAVQHTVIEPGWRGWLTLELTNHGHRPITLTAGMPIAQVIFHLLDHATDSPYNGRYQDQMPGPQLPLFGEDRPKS